MKLSTNNLKSMLGRVASCKATNLLEITNYYELRFDSTSFKLSGTDGTNFITVEDKEGASDEEVAIIVKADQFTKLINKTTKDEVDLVLTENCLEVRGNGIYKVEIVEGEQYPKFDLSVDSTYKVNLDSLKDGINRGKYAKSNVPNDGVLFSFLIRDEQIITADAIKVYNKVIAGEIEGLTALISPALANMILALDSKEVQINVDETDNKIQFVGENVVVSGAIVDGADDYPDLSEMIQMSLPYTVELDTKLVLQAIDRLNLFVTAYDKNVVDIVFTGNALTISTTSKSYETIPYITTLPDDVEFIATVNCKYLQDIFNSADEPSLKVEFGADDILKFDTIDSTMLLAVADDE